ncbi:MAG: hypothetical protein ACFFBE_16580, partial [Promethearchaeota archaeon]
MKIHEATDKLFSIFKAQSIDRITIPRQYLPEIFDNDLLELSDEDGLPILKKRVESEFKLSGIPTKIMGTVVIFYKGEKSLLDIFPKEGADDNIVKPFSGETVLKSIEDLLDLLKKLKGKTN